MVKLKRWRRIAIIILTALSFFLVWIFTPAVIIPPNQKAQETPIYILDLGWHPELILPNNQNTFTLYAYGDWNYFALNNQNLSDGLAALFIPTLGTLGKRTFNNLEEIQKITTQRNYTLLTVKVPQNKVSALIQQLERRFNQNIHTTIYNQKTGLTLVQDEKKYTILHNSNHELIEWLEELGCQVKGFVIWANFRVYTNI
ncbi:MAG TPA: DUF2459 domain-containing protein [Nostocaceae cyanobacterium]|nr:DUF2459 domain-containing protein [Nostocaceae cyanobacterium]